MGHGEAEDRRMSRILPPAKKTDHKNHGQQGSDGDYGKDGKTVQGCPVKRGEQSFAHDLGQKAVGNVAGKIPEREAPDAIV